MADGNQQGNEKQGIAHIVRSLRNRNYRLFFGGQSISLIGTWMQSVAMSWLIYRITDSPFMLGIVGFAGQIPAFIIAPFAGVFADRLNRHRIIIATQALSMVQALTLAGLTLTEHITVGHIMVLAAFLGVVNAFDMPTRQAFVLDMMENREDLSNAVALNSSMFNGARLVGPSIAGAIVAAAGEGVCFLLNGISYIAVIISLLMMRIPRREKPATNRNVLTELGEGFSYVFKFVPIRTILLLLGLVSLAGMPYSVLMPMFARDILHGGPSTLGLLTGASGVGALAGAFFLASRRSVLGLGKWISLAAVIFGAALVAFAFSRNLWLSAAMMAFAGFGMIVQMASSNTIIQTIAEEKMRGRVMAFYTMSFAGTAPFGSLLSGALAARIGPTDTVTLGGILCAIGGILFATKLPALREIVRPIYMKIGVIPEIADELQATCQLTTRIQQNP